MSDPHQPNDRAPAIEPEPVTGSEPDFMSIFLQNLLQSTPAVTWQDDRRSGGCISNSDGLFDKAFSSSGSGDYSDTVICSNKREHSNDMDKVLEASELAGNQVHPRCSKRTRSAEVHNLSEKKRRCKINEKLKALQTLIPNSNKTDKASMLDEAIEYLKQLQLQVQMLTVRNGFSLPLNYAPMQFPIDIDGRTLLPSIGRGAEWSNTSREADGLSGRGQEMVMQSGIQNPILLNHQLPVQSGNSNSKTPFLMDQCRDETLSHFPFDISCSGDNSSSEVSS